MTGRSMSANNIHQASSSGYTSPTRIKNPSIDVFLSATTALMPLVRDPHHILPVSVPGTPGGSPPLSRRNSPLPSARASMLDMEAEYNALAGPSSPRTSTSTVTRSDPESVDEDEFLPTYQRNHAPSWFTSGVESSLVSPKITNHRSRPPPLRIPSGRPKRWRRALNALGFTGTGSRTGTRVKERERLMSDFSSPLSRADDPKWFTRTMAYVPTTPWGIVSFLFFFGCFAVSMTILLKYILEPDKQALPWRAYCSSDYPTLYSLQHTRDPLGESFGPGSSEHPLPPPTYLDHSHLPPHGSTDAHRSLFPFGSSDTLTLKPLTSDMSAWPFPGQSTAPRAGEIQSALSDTPPVGVFVGVFTYDAAVARRNMIRMSYASHARSRKVGSKSVRLRFIMGRPSHRHRKAVELEMEAFNDIVILDIPENMNQGKTHAYFTWAAEHAMVDDYDFATYDLPVPASQSDVAARPKPVQKGERRPDYIVKADDDSFIMLGELERRLRVIPRKMAYWGYLVKNKFMGGQCYALSLDLAEYVASFPPLRQMTHGKEDKLVSRWMTVHPQKENIVWVSEKCGIYDHPRAGTVYSHGFLFPSEIAKTREEQSTGLDTETTLLRGGLLADAYSTVSKFGVPFRPLRGIKTAEQNVESLVEGSPLSKLRDYPQGPASVPESEWRVKSNTEKVSTLFDMRPSRSSRFLDDADERGGTVVVHYIKKREWFIETMVALLGTSEHHLKGT
ncbi:hypothetical protein BD324DRAFT_639680 [Kockovaella imperatae]|uniref:Galactosyltransferase-domain-containing protein n=1 Tax=Kockovaella imperatae TaxID=4999 RepID=A0A1Y1U6A6_9TREE|nr:hypothetical protein BD324DRAFT_639680 [Kockovaella imperatae]ORX33532.1 hypothetical protein BD324DRAFT_639680 [Kockovaella imperatae]